MEDEDKKKKLLAGKEKLLAFQKKKLKRKKRKKTGADEDGNVSDYSQFSETSSLADLSDFSDVNSVTYESDQGSVMDEDSLEERPQRGHRDRSDLRNDLKEAFGRITELEENLLGKQAALDSMIEENDQLRVQLAAKPGREGSTESGVSTPDLSDLSSIGGKEGSPEVIEVYQQKISELQSALNQRDEVIAQLSANLTATTESRDSMQQEYTAQAGQLASQVQTLQLQLQQAGEYLRNVGEHGIPAQALLEAKNELLALQQANKHKQNEVTVLQETVKQREQTLHQIVEQFRVLSQQVEVLSQENTVFHQKEDEQKEMISRLSSEVEQVASLKREIIILKEKGQEVKPSGASPTTQLEVLLKEKEKEISTLKDAIQQKDLCLQQMALKFNENTQELQQLVEQNAAFKQRDQEWHMLQTSLAEKEDQIRSKEEELLRLRGTLLVQTDTKQTTPAPRSIPDFSAIHNDAQSMKKALEEMAMELKLYYETTEQKEHALSVISQNLEQSRTENQHLTEELNHIKHNMKHVNKIEQDLLEKENTVAKLQEAVNIRDHSLAALAEKMQMITPGKEATLQHELEQYKNIIQQKEHSLHILNQHVEHSRLQVAQFTEEVSILREQISKDSKLKQSLAESRATITKLQEEVRTRDQSLQDLLKKQSGEEKLVQDLNNSQKSVIELKQVMDRKEEELLALQEMLRGKDLSLQTLQAQIAELSQVSLHCEDLRNKVQLDQEALIAANQSLENSQGILQKQEGEMRNMKLQLEEKEQEIKLFQKTVSEKNAIIEENKNTASERNQTIQQTSKELQAVKDENMHLNEEIKSLKQIKNEFLQLEQTVQKKDREMEHYMNVLHQKDESLAQMTQTMTVAIEKSSQSEEFSKLLEEREKQILVLNTQLQDVNIKVLNLEETVSQRERSLLQISEKLSETAQENAQLLEQVKLLGQFQNELKKAQEALGRREENVLELTQALDAKDKSLGDLKQLLDTSASDSELLSELRQSLSLKSEEYETVHQNLVEKERVVSVMREELLLKDQSLQEMTERTESQMVLSDKTRVALEEKDSEIQTLQGGISNLQSIVWEKDQSIHDLIQKLTVAETHVRSVVAESVDDKQQDFVGSLLQAGPMEGETVMSSANKDPISKEETLKVSSSAAEGASADLDQLSVPTSDSDNISDNDSEITSLRHALSAKDNECKHLQENLLEKEQLLAEVSQKLSVSESAVNLPNVTASPELERHMDVVCPSCGHNALQSAHEGASQHLSAEGTGDSQSRDDEIIALKHIILSLEGELTIVQQSVTDKDTSLTQLSDQLEELLGAVAEKEEIESRCDSMQEKIQSLESQLSDQQTVIVQTEEQLTQVRGQLEEAHIKDNQLKEAEESAANRLSELEGAIQEKDDEVAALFEACQEKEQKIKAVTHQLTGLQQAKAQEEEILAVQNQELEQLRNVLNAKEAEANNLKDTLTARETELQQVSEQYEQALIDGILPNSEPTINGKEQSLCDSASQTSADIEFKPHVDGEPLLPGVATGAGDEELGSLRQTLVHRDEELQELREGLVDKEQSLKDLTLQLAQVNEDNTRQLEMLQESLRERELELDHLRTAAIDQVDHSNKEELSSSPPSDSEVNVQAEIESIKNALEEKNGEISALQEAAAESSAQLSAGHEMLKEKDGCIEDLTSQKSSLSEELDRLQKENEWIKTGCNYKDVVYLQDTLKRKDEEIENLWFSLKVKEDNLEEITSKHDEVVKVLALYEVEGSLKGSAVYSEPVASPVAAGDREQQEVCDSDASNIQKDNETTGVSTTPKSPLAALQEDMMKKEQDIISYQSAIQQMHTALEQQQQYIQQLHQKYTEAVDENSRLKAAQEHSTGDVEMAQPEETLESQTDIGHVQSVIAVEESKSGDWDIEAVILDETGNEPNEDPGSRGESLPVEQKASVMETTEKEHAIAEEEPFYGLSAAAPNTGPSKLKPNNVTAELKLQSTDMENETKVDQEIVENGSDKKSLSDESILTLSSALEQKDKDIQAYQVAVQQQQEYIQQLLLKYNELLSENSQLKETPNKQRVEQSQPEESVTESSAEQKGDTSEAGLQIDQEVDGQSVEEPEEVSGSDECEASNLGDIKSSAEPHEQSTIHSDSFQKNEVEVGDTTEEDLADKEKQLLMYQTACQQQQTYIQQLHEKYTEAAAEIASLKHQLNVNENVEPEITDTRPFAAGHKDASSVPASNDMTSSFEELAVGVSEEAEPPVSEGVDVPEGTETSSNYRRTDEWKELDHDYADVASLKEMLKLREEELVAYQNAVLQQQEYIKQLHEKFIPSVAENVTDLNSAVCAQNTVLQMKETNLSSNTEKGLVVGGVDPAGDPELSGSLEEDPIPYQDDPGEHEVSTVLEEETNQVDSVETEDSLSGDKLPTEQSNINQEVSVENSAPIEIAGSLSAQLESFGDKLMKPPNIPVIQPLPVSKNSEHDDSLTSDQEGVSPSIEEMLKQREEEIVSYHRAVQEQQEYISQLYLQYTDAVALITNLKAEVEELKHNPPSDKSLGGPLKDIMEDYRSLQQVEKQHADLIECLKEDLSERPSSVEYESLKKKEKETSAVLKQLMLDVENLQKGGAQRSAIAGNEGLGEVEVQKKLDSLQSELEELHGQQIVEMKHQLLEQQTIQLTDIKKELKEAVEENGQMTEKLHELQSINSALMQQVELAKEVLHPAQEGKTTDESVHDLGYHAPETLPTNYGDSPGESPGQLLQTQEKLDEMWLENQKLQKQIHELQDMNDLLKDTSNVEQSQFSNVSGLSYSEETSGDSRDNREAGPSSRFMVDTQAHSDMEAKVQMLYEELARTLEEKNALVVHIDQITAGQTSNSVSKTNDLLQPQVQPESEESEVDILNAELIEQQRKYAALQQAMGELSMANSEIQKAVIQHVEDSSLVQLKCEDRPGVELQSQSEESSQGVPSWHVAEIQAAYQTLQKYVGTQAETFHQMHIAQVASEEALLKRVGELETERDRLVENQKTLSRDSHETEDEVHMEEIEMDIEPDQLVDQHDLVSDLEVDQKEDLPLLHVEECSDLEKSMIKVQEPQESSLQNKDREIDSMADEKRMLLKKIDVMQRLIDHLRSMQAGESQKMYQLESTSKSQEMELESITKDLQSLQLEKSILAEQLEIVSEERQACQTQLGIFADQVEYFNTQKKEDDIKLLSAVQKEEHLLAQLEEHRSENTDLNAKIVEMKQISADLETVKEGSMASLTKLSQDVESLQKDRENLLDRVADMETQNSKLHTSLEDALESKQLLEVEHETLLIKVNTLESQIIKLKQDLQEESKCKAELEEGATKMDITIKNLEERFECNQEVKESLEKERDQLMTSLESAETENVGLKSKLDEALQSYSVLKVDNEDEKERALKTEEKFKLANEENTVLTRTVEELKSQTILLKDNLEQAISSLPEKEVVQRLVEETECMQKEKEVLVRSLDEARKVADQQTKDSHSIHEKITLDLQQVTEDLRLAVEEKSKLGTELEELKLKSIDAQRNGDVLKKSLEELQQAKHGLESALDNMSKELEVSQSNRRELENTVCNVTEKNKKLELDFSHEKSKLEVMSGTREEAQEKVKSISLELEQAVVQKVELGHKMEALSDDLKTISDENRDIKAKLNTVSENMEIFILEKNAIQNELKELSCSHEQTLVDLDNERKKHEIVTHDLQQAQEEKISLQKRVEELSNELQRDQDMLASSGTRMDLLGSELNEIHQEKYTLESKVEELSTDLFEAQDAQEDMQSKVQSLTKTLEESQEEITKLNIKVEALSSELAVAYADSKAAHEQLPEIEKEKEDLQNKLQAISLELDNTLESNTELQAKLDKLELIEESSSKLKKQVNELISLNEDLTGNMEDYSSVQEKNHELLSKVEELEKSELQLGEDLTNARTQVELLSSDKEKLVEEMEEQHDKMRSEVASLKNNLSRVEKEREDLNQQLMDAESSNSQMKSTLQQDDVLRQVQDSKNKGILLQLEQAQKENAELAKKISMLQVQNMDMQKQVEQGVVCLENASGVDPLMNGGRVSTSVGGGKKSSKAHMETSMQDIEQLAALVNELQSTNTDLQHQLLVKSGISFSPEGLSVESKLRLVGLSVDHVLKEKADLIQQIQELKSQNSQLSELGNLSQEPYVKQDTINVGATAVAEVLVEEKQTVDNILKEHSDMSRQLEELRSVNADLLNINEQLTQSLAEQGQWDQSSDSTQGDWETEDRPKPSKLLRLILEDKTKQIVALQAGNSELQRQMKEQIKFTRQVEEARFREERSTLNRQMEEMQTKYDEFQVEKSQLLRNVKDWENRYEILRQKNAMAEGTTVSEIDTLRKENRQLMEKLAQGNVKIETDMKERKDIEEQLTIAKADLDEFKTRNPDIVSYRRKIEDLNDTLKVTWIENEQLKKQIMSLKGEVTEGLTRPGSGLVGGPAEGDAEEIEKKKETEVHVQSVSSDEPIKDLETLKIKLLQVEEEKRLSEEASDALVVKLKQDHADSVKELTSYLESVKAELESNRKKQEKEIEKFISQLEEYKANLELVEKEKEDLSTEKKSFTQQLLQSENQVQVLEMQCSRITEEKDIIKKEKANLVEMLQKENSEQVALLTSQVEMLQGEKAELNAKYKQEIEVLHNKLALETHVLQSEREESVKELTDHLDRHQVKCQNLQSELNKVSGEMEEMEAQYLRAIVDLKQEHEVIMHQYECQHRDDLAQLREHMNVVISEQLSAEGQYEKELAELRQKVSLEEEGKERVRLQHEGEMKRLISELERMERNTNELQTKLESISSSGNGHETPVEENIEKAGQDFGSIEEVVAHYKSQLQKVQTRHEANLEANEYSLSEKFEVEKRQLQAELEFDLEEKLKKQAANYDRQIKQHKERIQKECNQNFVVELRKARKELSARQEEEVERLRIKYEVGIIHRTVSESEKKLEDMIIKLQQDNQELAEARDSLLSQLESCSQDQDMQAAGAPQQSHDSESTPALRTRHYSEDSLDESQNVDAPKSLVRNPDLPSLDEPKSQQESKVNTNSHQAESRNPEEHNDLASRLGDVPSTSAELFSEVEKLQKENLELKCKMDDHNFEVIESLQKELSEMQSKYEQLWREHESLVSQLGGDDDLDRIRADSLEEYGDMEECQGHFDESDKDISLPRSVRPQLTRINSKDSLDDDFSDYRRKLEALRRENQALRSRLRTLGESDRVCEPEFVQDLHSKYDSIAEENEVLRAKLGRYGLPTEGLPEEEHMDLVSKYEAIRRENEILRAKLDAYELGRGENRDEDWKTKYDVILKEYETIKSQLSDSDLLSEDIVQRGLEDLQVKFDAVVKEREQLGYKLDTVQENATKDFADLQTKYAEAQKECEELKGILSKSKDKIKRDYTKLRAKHNIINKELEEVKKQLQTYVEDENREAEGMFDATMETIAGDHINEVSTLRDQCSSLVSENTSLRTERDTLKARLMDKLRSNLKNPPLAHSTPQSTQPAYSSGDEVHVLEDDFDIPQDMPTLRSLYKDAKNEINRLQGELDTLQGETLNQMMVHQNETEPVLSPAQDDINNVETHTSGTEPEKTTGVSHEKKSKKRKRGKRGRGTGSNANRDTCTSKTEVGETEKKVEFEEINNDSVIILEKEYQALLHSHQLLIQNGVISETEEHYLILVKKHEELMVALQQEKQYAQRKLMNLNSSVDQLYEENKSLKDIVNKHSLQGSIKSEGTDSHDVKNSARDRETEHPEVIEGDRQLVSPNNKHDLDLSSVPVSNNDISSKHADSVSASFASISLEDVHKSFESEPGANNIDISNVGFSNHQARASDLMAEEFICEEESSKIHSSLGQGSPTKQIPGTVSGTHYHGDGVDCRTCQIVQQSVDHVCQVLVQARDILPEEPSPVQSETTTRVFETHLQELTLPDFAVNLKNIKCETCAVVWHAIEEMKRVLVGMKSSHVKSMELIEENHRLRRYANVIIQIKATLNRLQLTNQEICSQFMENLPGYVRELLKQPSDTFQCGPESKNDDMNDVFQSDSDIKEIDQNASSSSEMGCNLEKDAHKIVDLDDDYENNFEEVMELKQTIAWLQSENKNLVRENDELMSKLAEKSDTTGGMEESVKDAKTVDSPDECEMGRLQGEYTELKAVHDNVSQENEKLKEYNLKILNDFEQLKDQYEVLYREKEQSEMELGHSMQDCHELKYQIQKISKLNTTISEAIEKGDADLAITTLQTRNEDLVKRNEDLCKENERLHYELEDMERDSKKLIECLHGEKVDLENQNQQLLERFDKDVLEVENQLIELQRQYDQLADENAVTNDEFKAYRDKHEKEMANLKTRYDDTLKENDFLHSQLLSAKDNAERDIGHIQAINEELQHEKENMERQHSADKDKLIKEYEEVKISMDSLRKEHEDLKGEMYKAEENVDSKVEVLQNRCRDLDDENKLLKKDFEELHNRFVQQEKIKNDGEKQYQELSDKYSSLSKYVDQIKEKLNLENKDLSQKLAEVETEYQKLAIINEDLKSTRTAISQDLDDSQMCCEALERSEAELREENKSLKEELEQLNKEFENMLKAKGELVDEDNEEVIRSRSGTLHVETSCKTIPEEDTPTREERMKRQDSQSEKPDTIGDSGTEESLVEVAEQMGQGPILSRNLGNWRDAYYSLQEKYSSQLKENEDLHSKLLAANVCDQHHDSEYSELVQQNAILRKTKTRVEHELMSQKIDQMEIQSAFGELVLLKEEKLRLENQLDKDQKNYHKEKELLLQKIAEMQIELDKTVESKKIVQEDMRHQQEKYDKRLSEVRSECLKGLETDERSKIMEQISSAEKEVGDLQQKVRSQLDEKNFLELQVSHLKKECELYERHVRDLEKEVERQASQLREAAREHKEMIKVLAETRLELELGRETQQHNVSRIEDAVNRIEAQFSGRSTPLNTSRSVCSVHSFDEESRVQSDPGVDEDFQRGHIDRLPEDLGHIQPDVWHTRSRYFNRQEDPFGPRLSSTRESDSGDQSYDFPAEVVTLKEKVSLLEESNRILTEEKNEIQQRLHEQEEVVSAFQKQLQDKDGEKNFEELFGRQISLLKSERDKLRRQLNEHRDKDRKLTLVIHEKTVINEKSSKEMETFRQKLQDKEAAIIELLRERLALERHIREQQRLYELLQTKLRLEQEMQQQQHLLESELGELQRAIHDKDTVLRAERVQLLGELKIRSVTMQRLSVLPSQPQPEHSSGNLTEPSMEVVTHSFTRSSNSSSVVERLSESELSGSNGAEGEEENINRLERMRGTVEDRYKEAINRLRRQLTDQVPPHGLTLTKKFSPP